MVKPFMSQAQVPLVVQTQGVDEKGRTQSLLIPDERPLTLYLNRRELVTLMTLGSSPECLVLGWLRNQNLAQSLDDIQSIQVDWDVASAAVLAHEAVLQRWDLASQQRLVTTGCGQGAHHGSMTPTTQVLGHQRLATKTLVAIVAHVRSLQTVYKEAGSVHGCGLFRGTDLLIWIEDVGRHNAVDAIAGWMWMNDIAGHDLTFYTTGRLTSEMVVKSAHMGIPILLSRSGATRMGLEMAREVGMTLVSRCVGEHFLVLNGEQRLMFENPLETEIP